ncbi:histidine kinase [Streptomyces sp. CA-253872]|uniref:sensor histidine kinase n=1 Tax=Streptomyces sp. CA-253872 TaxID=3240067 RepID=UPI003D92E4D0
MRTPSVRAALAGPGAASPAPSPPPAPSALRGALPAPALRRLATARPRLALALAWLCALTCAALDVWCVAVAGPDATGLRLLPVAAACALLVPLAVLRPRAALAVLLAVSFTTVVRADSAMKSLPGPVPSPGTQAWQLACVHGAGCALLLCVIAHRSPAVWTLGAGLVSFAVQLGAATYYRPGSLPVTGAFLALVTVTAGVLGRAARERRAHAEALRAAATERAVVDERLRIARELHDMVAHSIGVIAIQAGVGRRVLTSRPEEARSALAAVEEHSRETLAGLRRVLGALRGTDTDPGPAPALAGLPALLARTHAAGLRAELVREGRRALPGDVDSAAYRIVQEALTNVLRHSTAGVCQVRLAFGPQALRVEITDAGPARKAGQAVGFGLAGMRERAALLGGELRAGPRPEGGFEVVARLPVEVGRE